MVTIFYKSYLQDFEWLYCSLLSLDKFATGYEEIVIVIPERELHTFISNSNYAKLLIKLNCIIDTVPEYGLGYLYQQYVKMTAHKYTQQPYILFVDSDCIFDRPVNVQDYINNEKPVILYTDYSKVGDAQCWKECTEKFVGLPQQYEFMRRIPLMYHRNTLVRISNMYPDLEYHIMNSERFSEFNAIGAWAFIHEKAKYTFINTDEWEFQPNVARQFHSYTGFTPEVKEEITSILVTPINTTKIER